MSKRLDTDDEEDLYLQERTAGLDDLDPTPAQADRKRKKKRKEKDENEDLIKGYRDALQTYEGRLVFHDLLDRMGYWTVAFTAGAPDVTAFQNGQREIALELYNLLWAVDSDAVLTMLKENRT